MISMTVGKKQLAVTLLLSFIICVFCQNQYVLEVELQNCSSTRKPNGIPTAIYVVPVYTNENRKYGVIPECIDKGYIDKHCNPGQCVENHHGANCTGCYINSTGCFNDSSNPDLSLLNSRMTFRYASPKKYLYLVVKIIQVENTIAVLLGTKANQEEVIIINVDKPQYDTLNTSSGKSIDIKTIFTNENERKPDPNSITANTTTHNNVKMSPGSKTVERNGNTFFQVTSTTVNYSQNNGHKTNCYWVYHGLTMVLMVMNMFSEQSFC